MARWFRTLDGGIVCVRHSDEFNWNNIDPATVSRQVKHSEKAEAYKLMLNAIKRQGARTDLTFGQGIQKFNAYEELAKQTSESAKTIQRYIRLTYLIPDLLQAVDNKKLGFIAAEQVSHLDPELQMTLWNVMQEKGTTPTKAQAYELHRYHAEGILSREIINEIVIGKMQRTTHTGDDVIDEKLKNNIRRAWEIHREQII